MMCLYCGKQQWGITTITTSSGVSTYITLRSGTIDCESTSSDTFCPGHIIEQCSLCKWYTFLNYHTPEYCASLRIIPPAPAKIEIPQAFYDAFEQEANDHEQS